MLYQWNFVIEGMFPDQVKLKRKLWLKKDEILLEKKGKNILVYVLGDDQHRHENVDKVIPYLWMSCLISNNSPEISGGGGVSIFSKKELGTKSFLSASISTSIPNEAADEMGEYASKYLIFIRNLHDKYIEIVNENEFLKIALDYFHDTQTKFVYIDEGFISAMISMEALFNESSNDIKYKISHRAAFLLGLCGLDSEESFENIKNLYDSRSAMVHGAGIPKKNKADRGALSRYARRSIIIFLILLSNPKRRKIGKGNRKSSLLKEIDYAMLSIEKRAVLEKEINKKLSSFKLNIPRTFEGEGQSGKYCVTAW